MLLEVSLDDTVEMTEDPTFQSIVFEASGGEPDVFGTGLSASLYEPEPTLSPISIDTAFESAETPDEYMEEPVITAYV